MAKHLSLFQPWFPENLEAALKVRNGVPRGCITGYRRTRVLKTQLLTRFENFCAQIAELELKINEVRGRNAAKSDDPEQKQRGGKGLQRETAARGESGFDLPAGDPGCQQMNDHR